jgi:hypothetical protein
MDIISILEVFSSFSPKCCQGGTRPDAYTSKTVILGKEWIGPVSPEPLTAGPVRAAAPPDA